MIRRLYPDPADIGSAAELEDEYVKPAGRHVRANFVTSLDGMVEVDGRSQPLGGPADRAAFMAMRAVADVVLVGAGTVRMEEYGPVRLDPAVEDRRRSRGQEARPALAIVSNRGELDPADRVFTGGDRPLLLTTAAAAADHPELAEVAEVVVCGEQWVELALALDELVDRGLARVLCEGGPTLLRSLVGGGSARRAVLHHLAVPGRSGPPQPARRPVAARPGRPRLDRVYEADGMILARYSIGSDVVSRPPTLSIERALWEQGRRVVVGVDEVGRGSWAGPLMVGAAVLPQDRRVYRVRDSKMLREPERERLFDRVADWCAAWAVGAAVQEECDEIGMADAQRLAARTGDRGSGRDARPGARRRQLGLRRASGARSGSSRATPPACPSPPPRSWPRSPATGSCGPRRTLSRVRVRRQQGLPVPAPQDGPARLRAVGDPPPDVDLHGAPGVGSGRGASRAPAVVAGRRDRRTARPFSLKDR